MSETPEMVERVAKAIMKRRWYDCEPDAYGNDLDLFYAQLDPDHVFDAYDEATAVIEAMRVPNKAMTRPSDDYTDRLHNTTLWQLMITAALTTSSIRGTE